MREIVYTCQVCKRSQSIFQQQTIRTCFTIVDFLLELCNSFSSKVSSYNR